MPSANAFQSGYTYNHISKKPLLLIKTTLFSLLFIGTLAEKKPDTPHHESVLFHSVLRAYPTGHSWIITAHISLGDINRQLHMFSHQKTLAHQLLVKLQSQLLASYSVLNALLDEFSNRQHLWILQASHKISSTAAQNWVRKHVITWI